MLRRLSRFVPLLALPVVLSSCSLQELATNMRDAGAPLPWYCNSKEEIPVTAGPAVGNVDYYAGTHKAPLSWDQCIAASGHFDAAKAYAMQWPTAGAAEADGFFKATPYVDGMGTHHMKGGLTPQMLNDPGFNKDNPNLDAAGLDDVFDPDKPEVLQYDGNTKAAKLVGFDYYVRSDNGPPEGFPGNQDWWHIHPKICFRKTDAVMIGFNSSDSSCASGGGVQVNMSHYYMLHVWVLEGGFQPDVYAGMIPCISGGTAIHDPLHPCHTSRTWTTSAAQTAASSSGAKRGSIAFTAEAAPAPGAQFICHGETTDPAATDS